MIDGGPCVIKTPLRLSFCDHSLWLQPLQVGKAAQPVKDPPSPTPWALVLDVLMPTGMWHCRYNDYIHFHSWSMVTQDSFLVALKFDFPERKEKNLPQASILNGFLIKLMM